MSPSSSARPRIGWGAVLEVRFGPEDVGRRISVRAAAPEDPARTADSVGQLLAWTPHALVVERRDGSRVEVPHERVLAGRVVAPEVSAAELQRRCAADPAATVGPADQAALDLRAAIAGSSDDAEAAERGWTEVLAVDVLTSAAEDVAATTPRPGPATAAPAWVDIRIDTEGPALHAAAVDAAGEVLGRVRALPADRWASIGPIDVALGHHDVGVALLRRLGPVVVQAGARSLWTQAVADDDATQSLLETVGFRPHHRLTYRRPR